MLYAVEIHNSQRPYRIRSYNICRLHTVHRIVAAASLIIHYIHTQTNNHKI